MLYVWLVSLVEEKTLKFGGFKGQALLYQAKGSPVLFLHGLSYTIGVWQRIGATEILEEKKVPFLALDMPYGLKSNCHPKNRDSKANVNYAMEAYRSVFGDQPPLVVGASIGGYIALQYSKIHPVKALLLISPAHAFKRRFSLLIQTFPFPSPCGMGQYGYHHLRRRNALAIRSIAKRKNAGVRRRRTLRLQRRPEAVPT